LLDQLYFVSKGRAALDFKELDLKEINKTVFLKMARQFPRQVQKLARELLRFNF